MSLINDDPNHAANNTLYMVNSDGTSVLDIRTTALSPDSVNEIHIARNAVVTDKIQDGAVDTPQIAE